MDVMDEIKHLQQCGDIREKAHKKTYDEYNGLIINRLKRINAELYLLQYELAAGESEKKQAEITHVFNTFSIFLQEMHEQLKTAFY